MKAVVAAFNQEKALVGAFSVITNLRMELFQALVVTLYCYHMTCYLGQAWGCVTLTYTTPGRALHLPSCRTEAASIAARLAALLAELCVATSPVILHCLGPDSALMYTLLTQVQALLALTF